MTKYTFFVKTFVPGNFFKKLYLQRNLKNIMCLVKKKGNFSS